MSDTNDKARMLAVIGDGGPYEGRRRKTLDIPGGGQISHCSDLDAEGEAALIALAQAAYAQLREACDKLEAELAQKGPGAE